MSSSNRIGAVFVTSTVMMLLATAVAWFTPALLAASCSSGSSTTTGRNSANGTNNAETQKLAPFEIKRCEIGPPSFQDVTTVVLLWDVQAGRDAIMSLLPPKKTFAHTFGYAKRHNVALATCRTTPTAFVIMEENMSVQEHFASALKAIPLLQSSRWFPNVKYIVSSGTAASWAREPMPNPKRNSMESVLETDDDLVAYPLDVVVSAHWMNGFSQSLAEDEGFVERLRLVVNRIGPHPLEPQAVRRKHQRRIHCTEPAVCRCLKGNFPPFLRLGTSLSAAPGILPGKYSKHLQQTCAINSTATASKQEVPSWNLCLAKNRAFLEKHNPSLTKHFAKLRLQPSASASNQRLPQVLESEDYYLAAIVNRTFEDRPNFVARVKKAESISRKGGKQATKSTMPEDNESFEPPRVRFFSARGIVGSAYCQTDDRAKVWATVSAVLTATRAVACVEGPGSEGCGVLQELDADHPLRTHH